MDTDEDVRRLVGQDSAIEVFIGLTEQEHSSKLDIFMGDDGDIISCSTLAIARVKLTPSCLEDLLYAEPQWIDYIETTETNRRD